MQASKGIVMSISDKGIIVLGSDGLFYRLPPTRHVPLIGDEVVIDHALLVTEQKKSKVNPWIRLKGLRRWGLVAAILLAILTSVLIYPSSPEAAYIVALEINPSLELYMNQSDEVIQVVALNEDANLLLKDLNLLGSQLSVAIEQIASRAEEKGYLQEKNQPLIITVVDWDKESKQEDLRAKVEEQMAEKLRDRSFVVTSASREILEQAHEKNLPVYKYQVVKTIEEEGIILDDQVITSSSAEELAKQYNITPPGLTDAKNNAQNKEKNEKKKDHPKKEQNEKKSEKNKGKDPKDRFKEGETIKRKENENIEIKYEDRNNFLKKKENRNKAVDRKENDEKMNKDQHQHRSVRPEQRQDTETNKDKPYKKSEGQRNNPSDGKKSSNERDGKDRKRDENNRDRDKKGKDRDEREQHKTSRKKEQMPKRENENRHNENENRR